MTYFPAPAMSQGQADLARSMIRMLKAYRGEKDNFARREIGKAVLEMAKRLSELPDAGGYPSRPGSNPSWIGPKPPPPANPPSATERVHGIKGDDGITRWHDL